ncbi:MAG: glutathione S-transferase N-terminal domain-containing protein [Thermoleophilaceae bacterium]
MAIKLHTCGNPWLGGPHPCGKVRKAFEESGQDFEIVKHPTFPRGRRNELKELSAQDRLPVIELEDGTIIREESSDMAARVREGRLQGSAGAAP